MAIKTTTWTTYPTKGIREDLSDIISNISPSKTPFFSMARKGTCDNTLHEWQTDSLASAVTTNQNLEGDFIATTDWTSPSATTRVGNYTEIARKLVSVSGTNDAVSKAGRRSEMNYQKAKKGLELRRDIESALLANKGGNAGGTGTARQLASLGAWVKTNDYVSTSGGSPTYASGVPAAARTDGTQVAFSETNLKSTILLCYQSGAEPNILMVGPFNKQTASSFTGIATQTYDVRGASPTTIVAAASVYVSDFGNFSIIPNLFQRARDAWLLDFDYISVMTLRGRGFMTENMAKTGDSTDVMMINEYTLKVHNEAALGLVADCTTS